MNNTLCLMVFTVLVFARGLSWQFSAGVFSLYCVDWCILTANVVTPAEVTVVLLIEFAVGILAIIAGFGFKHTYVVSLEISILGHSVNVLIPESQLILGFLVGALYFFSIFLIFSLEYFANWK